MGMEARITSVPAPAPLQPGEFVDGQFVEVVTAGLEQLRLVAVANELECALDMGDEVIVLPPFCAAPG